MSINSIRGGTGGCAWGDLPQHSANTGPSDKEMMSGKNLGILSEDLSHDSGPPVGNTDLPFGEILEPLPDSIKWMYFSINVFEVGVNDSILLWVVLWKKKKKESKVRTFRAKALPFFIIILLFFSIILLWLRPDVKGRHLVVKELIVFGTFGPGTKQAVKWGPRS